MKTILLLAIILFQATTIVGCGADLSKLEAAEKAAEGSPSPEPGAAAVSTTPVPLQAGAQASPVPSSLATVTSTCTASSTTTVTDGGSGQASQSAGPQGAVFYPKLGTWADAQNNAPAGKRLASRGEILLLVDQGIFKGSQWSAAPAVWTATDIDATRAWSAAVVDGSLAESDKDWGLGAVYVNQ